MELVSRTEAPDSRYHIKAKRSGLVRFYLWLYDANPRNVDTCKLFWGTVFSPLVLPLVLLLLLAKSVGRALGSLLPEREEDEPTELDMMVLARKQEEKHTKRKTREQRLEAVGQFMGRIWFKISGVLGPVFAFLLPVLGVLAALALVAFVVFALVVWTHATLHVLLMALLCVGAVAVIVSLGIGLGELHNHYRRSHPKTRRNRGLFRKAFDSVHNHTCAKIDVVD
jgi:hypothetical protein